MKNQCGGLSAIVCGLFILGVGSIECLAVAKIPKGAGASSPVASQLQSLTQTINQKEAAMAQQRSKLQAFTISGEIRDREPNAVVVWGYAIPQNGDFGAFGALTQESNILVMNPDDEGILGGMYYEGAHYFLRKSSSKNAFGQPVPVWVYGGPPENLLRLEKELAELKKKRKKLRIDQIATEQAKRPIPPTDEQATDLLRALGEALAPLRLFQRITLDYEAPDLATLGGQETKLGQLSVWSFPEEGVLVSTRGLDVVGISAVLQPEILERYFSSMRANRFKPPKSFNIPTDIALGTHLDTRLDLTGWEWGLLQITDFPEIWEAVVGIDMPEVEIPAPSLPASSAKPSVEGSAAQGGDESATADGSVNSAGPKAEEKKKEGFWKSHLRKVGDHFKEKFADKDSDEESESKKRDRTHYFRLLMRIGTDRAELLAVTALNRNFKSVKTRDLPLSGDVIDFDPLAGKAVSERKWARRQTWGELGKD